MSDHTPTFYGIDPKIIAEATNKARRERSQAVWAMIGRIFPSVSDKAREEHPSEPSLGIGAGKVAHT